MLFCYYFYLLFFYFSVFFPKKYIFLGISLSRPTFPASFVTKSKLLCSKVLVIFVILFREIFAILLAIILPNKPRVVSAVFSIAFCQAVLGTSVEIFLTCARRF